MVHRRHRTATRGDPRIAAGHFSIGGSSGAYLRKRITTPAATYAYAVGAAGAGAGVGSTGFAGGAGAAGIIIIDAYYQ